MKYFIITIILLTYHITSGQNYKLKRALEKNILFYNLSIEIKQKQYFDNSDYAIHSSVWDGTWSKLIPEKGFSLNLFEVNSDLQYPDTSIVLIAFNKPRYEFYDSLTDQTYCFTGYISKQFDEQYLVGYSKRNNNIKFISGNIFKDKIWTDFKSKGFNKQNLINFLKVKCYNFNVLSIDYLYKRGSKYFFVATFKGFTDAFSVVFDAKNPDIVLIKHKRYSITT